jgi:hypothetical protein
MHPLYQFCQISHKPSCLSRWALGARQTPRSCPGLQAQFRGTGHTEGIFRTTTLLFFVRLVGKSKNPETERFAFDKPQRRLRHPVCEETPSLSHDKGLD